MQAEGEVQDADVLANSLQGAGIFASLFVLLGLTFALALHRRGFPNLGPPSSSCPLLLASFSPQRQLLFRIGVPDRLESLVEEKLDCIPARPGNAAQSEQVLLREEGEEIASREGVGGNVEVESAIGIWVWDWEGLSEEEDVEGGSALVGLFWGHGGRKVVR